LQSKLRVYKQINQEKRNLDAIINISEDDIQEIYIYKKKIELKHSMSNLMIKIWKQL